MNTLRSIRTELLAPAGSLEAFFAAIDAGADAVYCGLQEFSARAKAKNVSLAELEKMIAYAHAHGRRLYVAMNTLIKEEELGRAIEVLARLEQLRVDAVIIQDLGLWRIAHHHFPALRLHGSTQMAVHNGAGVKVLERLGFSRVVLARELRLDEIAAIRRQTAVELEHFVHGALCYSISGMCLFSSFHSGRSGNRGRCAQICRRRFHHRNQPGYPFSTRDFCALDSLHRLEEAGVISFKIEGRMKGAEYVGRVVSAYRQVLDAPRQDRKEALRAAHATLELSFGRRLTKGFLGGGMPTDIVSSGEKGGLGLFLGDVAKAYGDIVVLSIRERLHVGDQVRIQPISDDSGSLLTVREIRREGRKIKAAAAGDTVELPVPFVSRFQKGDSVYKVAGMQAYSASEEACRRKLAEVPARSTAMELAIQFDGKRFEIAAAAGSVSLAKQYDIVAEQTSSELSRKLLVKIFGKTGGRPLILETLEFRASAADAIPPARIKEIRNDFYTDLVQKIETAERARLEARCRTAVAGLLPIADVLPSAELPVDVAVREGDDLAILARPGIDRIIVPLTPRNVREVGKVRREHGERIIWDLPPIIYEGEWQEFRGAVSILVSQGFYRYRLNNIGHFHLFDGVAGNVRLVAGWMVYCLNSQSVLALRGLGAEGFCLSIEDDQENIRALLSKNTGVSSTVIVYGPVPLFTSRIPVKGIRSKAVLQDDLGEEFRVENRDGLVFVTAGRDFSLLGQLEKVRVMGCDRVLVDLSGCGASSRQGTTVLAALSEKENLPETTLFNFERGLV